MYLKSLKLVGFKSFADRTRLELRPGVTVVVGPNGSGKSNVVDAISWVMGTQSTKALRTSKMEDVVFAGTATRPALNRAEATVVIDNADRALDLDLDEVAITRRLYRDGSSDYELNGISCRLLDIEELLSDSGVGRHQHVIIGQGQVERVLNASPEDHRAVIEEAAGILKHRKRKEKAERRLERTDEDVVRLQDLLGEITRQMRPLKRQAKAAESYQGIKDEVTALTLYLSGRKLDEIVSATKQAVEDQARLRSDIEAYSADISSLSARVEEYSGVAGDLSTRLERDSAAAAVLETTSERLRRIAAIAHERKRALSGRREATAERQADLAREREALLNELQEIASSHSEAISAAEIAEERFRNLEAEQESIATQNALSPEGALAAVRGELSAIESASLRDERELKAIRNRIDVVNSHQRDEIDEVEKINQEILVLDSEIGELQKSYDRDRDRRIADQDAWTAAEERFSEARLVAAGEEARVEAIRGAVAGQVDDDARKRVEASTGAIGSLISCLDVPEGLEPAIESALGTWAGAVAFEGVGPLQDSVEGIKAGGMGGVPVVAAVSPGSTPAPEIAEALGVDALVDRLGPKAHRDLASRLLGDVLLVEGWTTAWRLIAKNPALRAVTPEGDLISVSGIRIAHPDGAGVAMLEAAEVALERARTELSRTESQHTSAKRDFEKSREIERESLEALEGLEARLAGCTEAMGRLKKSVETLGHEKERLDDRITSIREIEEQRSEQATQLRRRLTALEGEEAERMKAWEELESRRVAIAAEREVARSVWQQASERLRAIDERKGLHDERIKRIDAELGRLDIDGAAPVSTSTLSFVEERARTAVDQLHRRLLELRQRQAELRDSNREVLENLESARSEYELTRTRLDTARETLSKLDVRLTELRLEKESIAERLRRDADSTPDAALEARRPDLDESIDLDARLESRLAELSRLGPVNPLAAKEYGELKERHDFLSDQMADVESSRAELRKVISALDEEIESRFDTAYTEVAGAFQKYFSILFPGGKGRIRLVDADDSTSGLEIQAQPLGKKVSHLSLLSGGEKSLAALAFLFAVFEARPSPFYVLDEVEAALDDSNLRRFLKIVDEFRQQAQLVIITHQQQTMEAADVLYGVTMEPGGSSKVVRKVMSEVEASQVA
ncbi:MAG: chromosome segregation protein SMC [Acidimicrobiia bacterium]